MPQHCTYKFVNFLITHSVALSQKVTHNLHAMAPNALYWALFSLCTQSLPTFHYYIYTSVKSLEGWVQGYKVLKVFNSNFLTSDCIFTVILSVFHFPLRGLYMCLVATSSLILPNPSPTHGSGSSLVFRAANFHCFLTERPPNFLLPNVYEATCLRGAWPGDLYVGDSWSGMSPSEWALIG